MKRHILLINRGSGANERGLDAAATCRNVEATFREAGHEISSIVVDPGAVEEEIARAISKSPDAILVGGGDGTVSAAARLLGGTGIALGILPMGTFNLAARDLGVPLEIDAATAFLAEAEPLDIDVLEVAGKACLCTTILGFYPEFSNIFEKRDHGGRWWKKTFKLLAGLRSTFIQANPLRLSWDGDGGQGTARTKFSAFVPGSYKESAGLIPARTGFRSGTMTAYIGTHRRPSSALRGIFDYTVGRHEKNPELQIIKATDMTLRASRRKSCNVMLDGEILRLDFPIRLQILPGHLTVLTRPENLADDAVSE